MKLTSQRGILEGICRLSVAKPKKNSNIFQLRLKKGCDSRTCQGSYPEDQSLIVDALHTFASLDKFNALVSRYSRRHPKQLRLFFLKQPTTLNSRLFQKAIGEASCDMFIKSHTFLCLLDENQVGQEEQLGVSWFEDLTWRGGACFGASIHFKNFF